MKPRPSTLLSATLALVFFLSQSLSPSWAASVMDGNPPPKKSTAKPKPPAASQKTKPKASKPTPPRTAQAAQTDTKTSNKAAAFPMPIGKSAVALALAAAAPDVRSDDERILAAREAVRKGDHAALARIKAELGQHDLAVYLDFWALSQTLAAHIFSESGDLASIQAFLSRHEGEYPAERLRVNLIKALVKRNDWDGVSREYAKLIAPEQDMQCHQLQARLERYEEAALPVARKLWRELSDNSACQPVFDLLIQRAAVNPDDIWERIHRLAEANKTGGIRALWLALPADLRPPITHLEQALERAPLYLGHVNASLLSDAGHRQLFALALQRVARNDPSLAASSLRTHANHLNKSELAQAWAAVALQGGRRLIPDARDWYRATTPAVLTEENAQWKVRTALRAHDWGMVRNTIEGMPSELANRPEWVYWLGRAYKAHGQRKEAESLFQRIAGQPNFYSNLADEELGRKISVPPHAAAPTPDELNQIANRPGIRRALAWLRMDQRTEGVKEWNWALRGLSDRGLLAAATLAKQYGIYDRAISAADRTKHEHDYRLRYIAPFSDEVRTAAREQSVDDAWVYGLMRQESRFVTNARSTVGAAGLMQLMPATAKWVAKRIGLNDYNHSQVHDPKINLTLGTSYMRMVMENLDQHPVLASAAYNAGPGRAKRWRADIPLEGAIYAESIPFSETRDYVKKVMSNAVYYSVLFSGQPASLRDRLGIIAPRNGSDALKDADLP